MGKFLAQVSKHCNHNKLLEKYVQNSLKSCLKTRNPNLGDVTQNFNPASVQLTKLRETETCRYAEDGAFTFYHLLYRSDGVTFFSTLCSSGPLTAVIREE